MHTELSDITTKNEAPRALSRRKAEWARGKPTDMDQRGKRWWIARALEPGKRETSFSAIRRR